MTGHRSSSLSCWRFWPQNTSSMINCPRNHMSPCLITTCWRPTFSSCFLPWSWNLLLSTLIYFVDTWTSRKMCLSTLKVVTLLWPLFCSLLGTSSTSYCSSSTTTTAIAYGASGTVFAPSTVGSQLVFQMTTI